ncbi:QueT transporter family protein [Aminobacterium sp. MB27-C1]|uniref:QueT transporter family protein n=1 Tax=unclassified Aminobacterium TaxID=2685012 RepID=UPI0027DD7CCC|nr:MULTISPECIES: QueT transporter family protein [unclassified Aminobacterium]MEA4876924.1 QueT transporter family protein [Aminobacterium sp.]WMI72485.1 QueT transporter family protein [Aminobacterium sp. MB27-C1]
MNKKIEEFLTVKNIVIASLIAAIYATTTILLAPISYGPIQVRVAEALTLLPYLWPQAIPGLFIGCLISNFAGGFGLIDVVFGSLATLLAALVTSRMPNPYLAALPPVIFNALIVGGYLSVLAKMPFLYTAMYVGLGEIIACGFLGIPLIIFLEKKFIKEKRER